MHSDVVVGIVARNNEMLQHARDQICEQQLMIENLTTDLKLADRNTARPSDHFHDCDNAEIEVICPYSVFLHVYCFLHAVCVLLMECLIYFSFLHQIGRLKHIVNTEQVASHETKQRFSRFTEENDMQGQGQRAFDDESGSSEEHVAPCAAQNTFDRVLIQVWFVCHPLTITCADSDTNLFYCVGWEQIQHLQCKLRSLRDQLKQYEETNFIDVNALDEENWFQEEFAQGSARSCVEYATHLSKSVVKSARYLLELQQIVEDVGARLMGESCALQ